MNTAGTKPDVQVMQQDMSSSAVRLDFPCLHICFNRTTTTIQVILTSHGNERE